MNSRSVIIAMKIFSEDPINYILYHIQIFIFLELIIFKILFSIYLSSLSSQVISLLYKIFSGVCFFSHDAQAY